MLVARGINGWDEDRHVRTRRKFCICGFSAAADIPGNDAFSVPENRSFP